MARLQNAILYCLQMYLKCKVFIFTLAFKTYFKLPKIMLLRKRGKTHIPLCLVHQDLLYFHPHLVLPRDNIQQ